MNNQQYNKDTRNFLNLDKYIISRELQYALTQEKTYEDKDNNIADYAYNMEYNVYLVMFRVLNKEKKSFVYNYIHYSHIFTYTLLCYLYTRNNVLGNIYKEPGFFLTILDKYFIGNYEVNKNESLEDKLHIAKLYLDIDELLFNIINNQPLYLTVTVTETFKLINKLIYTTDNNHMGYLFKLAQERKDMLFINEIFKSVNNYQSLVDKLTEEQENPSISIINSCLFVVEDLDKLIKSIKDNNNNINVNAGPQPLRGQVNSINNFLSLLDMDYRNSLYNHNNYHSNRGYIGSNLKLDRNKFSFNNVHMNLGRTRWYSTTTNTKSNLVSTKTLLSKNLVNNDTYIFNQLGEYFKNLPINNDTQRTIENFLSNYWSILQDKKEKQRKKSPINYDLISNKFTKLLKDKELIFSDYINNSRNRVYAKKPNTKKDIDKNLALFYLNNILKEIDDSFIISIINGRLLRIININNKLNNAESSICLELGRDLIKYYCYCLYSKSKSLKDNNDNIDYTMYDWKKENTDIISVYNDKNDKLVGHIGAILVNWMLDLELVVVDWIKISSKESQNILMPSQEVLSTLKNLNNIPNLPHKMPMIVKPKPYYRKEIDGVIKERLGGYLLNDEKYTDELIIPKWNLKEPSVIKDKNVIYDLVNNINGVGFKINTDVLDFIYYYNDIHNLISNEDDYNDLVSKSKLNKSQQIELESLLSKKRLEENILGLARAYSNIHEFYLPVRIDYRGRLYCVSEYLNYQSNELAKSLLLFSKGEIINKTDSRAISYLKAYGANCFGNKLDKKSWNERTKWVDNNLNSIIKFRNGVLISQADNKLLFIAFCFEYNRLLQSLNDNDTIYFKTYLPIRLDASCNGYQHLALLSLDHNLAKELNLTKSTWNDPPKDLYSYIGACLIGIYSNKLKSNIDNDERDSYNRLIKLNILRTLLKKAILTKSYNISPLELIKDIQVNFEPCDNDQTDQETPFLDKLYRYKDDHTIILKLKDFNLIRLGIEEILNDDTFKLKKLIKYLNSIAKILTKLNLVISWGSPSGVEVNQSFLSTKEVRLKPFTYSKRTFSLIVPDEGKSYNKSKQIRAFMPNLVHSLDAASLALLVDLYFSSSNNTPNNENLRNIFSVHDCFGVTANNVENIMDLLKLVYVKIYSESNYLRKLDRGIKDFIKLNYGENRFDEEKLEIKLDEKNVLKFPSIEGVLGTDSSAASLILDSSYLAH